MRLCYCAKAPFHVLHPPGPLEEHYEALILSHAKADGSIQHLCLDFCGEFVPLSDTSEVRLASRLLSAYAIDAKEEEVIFERLVLHATLSKEQTQTDIEETQRVMVQSEMSNIMEALPECFKEQHSEWLSCPSNKTVGNMAMLLLMHNKSFVVLDHNGEATVVHFTPIKTEHSMQINAEVSCFEKELEELSLA